MGCSESHMDARTKTFSVSLNLDWFMGRTPYPEGYRGLLRTSDGVELEPADALSFLTLEKAKGRKLLPMGAGCGSPCVHEQQGCVGFDYLGGGCPGYYNDQVGGGDGEAA
jgi:hypothetical protein